MGRRWQVARGGSCCQADGVVVVIVVVVDVRVRIGNDGRGGGEEDGGNAGDLADGGEVAFGEEGGDARGVSRILDFEAARMNLSGVRNGRARKEDVNGGLADSCTFGNKLQIDGCGDVAAVGILGRDSENLVAEIFKNENDSSEGALGDPIRRAGGEDTLSLEAEEVEGVNLVRPEANRAGRP